MTSRLHFCTSTFYAWVAAYSFLPFLRFSHEIRPKKINKLAKACGALVSTSYSDVAMPSLGRTSMVSWLDKPSCNVIGTQNDWILSGSVKGKWNIFSSHVHVVLYLWNSIDAEFISVLYLLCCTLDWGRYTAVWFVDRTFPNLNYLYLSMSSAVHSGVS